MMVSVQEPAILGFLPGLYHRQCENHSDDLGELIDHFVETSQEVMPSTKWNP